MAEVKEKKEFKLGPMLAGVMGIMVAMVGLLFVVQMIGAAPAPYTCPYCGSTFSTYEELVEHVQSSHPTERLPIEVIWTGG